MGQHKTPPLMTFKIVIVPISSALFEKDISAGVGPSPER